MSEIKNSPLTSLSISRGGMVFKSEILTKLLDRIHVLTDVSPREILADIREVRVTRARWLAVIVLRKRAKKTSQIAAMMQRDHKAIGRVINRSFTEYETNPAFRDLVDEIMNDD